jgi:beta-lactam-binding protein with PASTA domain
MTGRQARVVRKGRRPALRLGGQDWYFAVALAFFVGVSVWFARAVQDFLAPASKAIGAPTLVGQTLSDAVATAERTGVKVVVVQRVASDRYPRDVVMRQDPPPGAQVREGRQISCVVSTGVVIFAMPDLRYESLREVGLDLSHDKLALGKVKIVSSDEVPANRVVAQDPLPLTSVRPGTVVNVSLSKGGPSAIRVPSFTDQSLDAARQEASDAHVQLGQIVWTPFGRYGPPRGTVVRQNPPFNAVIAPSQPVSLQVSAGPREAGYIIRQVHAVATVPEDAAATAGGSPTVRVSVTDETGTRNVYNAYAEPKQKLDFNLTAVGTAEVDVFVNDELLAATKIGVEPKVQERQQLGPPPPGSHRPKNPLEPNATPQPSPTGTGDPR